MSRGGVPPTKEWSMSDHLGILKALFCLDVKMPKG